MKYLLSFLVLPLALTMTVSSVSGESARATAAEPVTIALADGKLTLTAPAEWKKEQPKSRIVQYEFSAPAKEDKGKEDEEAQARITIMGAGGSIDANIERWKGQFQDAPKDKTKVEKFEVGKNTVHWVDIQGSFKDTMGAPPFAGVPPTIRKDYRMLGAIIVTENSGQYFIKMTGPNAVCEKLVEGFKKMLKELEAK
ncbi:hypothetical protein [Aureliella helgolandensis]|uniref:Uncharacterized protein n=1 Tax=Aureliella helgolandensis TaxID=2527968 RepID=A0A518G5B2_9BACT|nr:hypothetical protein [Aureliella helgolandensis]QDV23788.1 hypothetical protein Q31a_20930 [Aureliella helgolandensis]